MNHEKHEKILYTDECYVIQGAIFEVYREMGNGFLEAVYQECIETELLDRNIPFQSRPKITIKYKNKQLSRFYQPDLVCFDKIVVELKAVKQIAPEHRAQAINYLKATGYRLVLLANFGAYPKATVERLVL